MQKLTGIEASSAMLEQAQGTPGLDFIKTHSDEEILTVRTYLLMKHLHTNLFPSILI